MKLRKIVISVIATLGIVALLGQATFAATDKCPTTKGKPAQEQKVAIAKEMLAKLNLTADQKAKIKAIHKGAKVKVEAVRADKSLTAEQKKAKLQEIRKATSVQILQVLTPAQKKKLAAMQKNAEKAGKPGNAGKVGKAGKAGKTGTRGTK